MGECITVNVHLDNSFRQCAKQRHNNSNGSIVVYRTINHTKTFKFEHRFRKKKKKTEKYFNNLRILAFCRISNYSV